MLPKLIIIDKDGTLISFDALYKSWMESLIQCLSDFTGKDVKEAIYKAYGFDKSRCSFFAGEGYLCEITMQEARQKAIGAIAQLVGSESAEKALSECWKDCELKPDQLVPTCDLHPLLELLQNRGIKLVLCTNDSRERTVIALKHLELGRFFDLVVAHGDEGFKPKPDPDCVLAICRRLNVDPKDAVMVGDTRADTQMGKDAKLGKTIGVLTGVGRRDDLIHADVVLDSLEDLVSCEQALHISC